MLTAKERARHAAFDVIDNPKFASTTMGAVAIADAASSVWEPILREALALLRNGECRSLASGALAIKKLEEALGDEAN